MSDVLIGDVIAVGEHNDMVKIESPRPVQWVLLDPETALQVGMEIMKRSYYITTGIDEIPKKDLVNEVIYQKLITRVTHIINDMQRRKRPNGFIAREVVDRVLQEVT